MAKSALTEKQIGELAEQIYQLLKENDIWMDTDIYYNNRVMTNKDGNGQYQYDGSVYLYLDTPPIEPFYTPGHILSMTFEGPVYQMFNHGSYPAVRRKFDRILKRFGLYYEFHDAWNLDCCYEN